MGMMSPCLVDGGQWINVIAERVGWTAVGICGLPYVQRDWRNCGFCCLGKRYILHATWCSVHSDLVGDINFRVHRTRHGCIVHSRSSREEAHRLGIKFHPIVTPVTQ